MTYTHLLLREGESFLKGQNQAQFEQQLVRNLRSQVGCSELKRIRGRLILPYFPEHRRIRRVFGFSSYSPALKVEKSLEKLQEGAFLLLREKKGTFRVETNRAEKSFFLKSPEINILLGRFLEEKTPLQFSFSAPRWTLGVEINQEGAFLFLETITCLGGLPVGIEGQVALLLENEASLLAGILFLKRGCALFPFALKEKELALLQKFSPQPLHFTPIREKQELEQKLTEKKLSALVLGENFENYNWQKNNFVCFRPLLAYSSSEIRKELQKFAEI